MSVTEDDITEPHNENLVLSFLKYIFLKFWGHYPFIYMTAFSEEFKDYIEKLLILDKITRSQEAIMTSLNMYPLLTVDLET